MDVIYLDLAKAFDKVPHERLLMKVTSHGIEDEVWQWLRSWLKEREQRVCLDLSYLAGPKLSVESRRAPCWVLFYFLCTLTTWTWALRTTF